jgi:hypothetical protein
VIRVLTMTACGAFRTRRALRTIRSALVTVLCQLVCAALPMTASANPPRVTLYHPFEITLRTASHGANPYIDGPEVTAIFRGIAGSARGKVVTCGGFWDGDNVWRIRFAPTSAGRWAYETRSVDRGLGGKSGRLDAIPPTKADLRRNLLLRGFLERDGQAWKLSDSTSFLPAGDTQFSFSEEFTLDEWKAWMDVLHERGLNSFHGCIWLGKYTRAGIAPFPNGDPSTDKLDTAYFRRLDEMVRYANDRGIVMGLVIGGFPDNSRWFARFGTRARHDRWYRYCVRRYASYNVRWVLFGEVNERNPPWGVTWQQEVAHCAALVKAEDPYRHPLGSHHTSVDTSSAANPDIDYIEVQINRNEDQYRKALDYRRWGKPVWFEEFWYEPASYEKEHHDSVALGIRNTHRNFVSALAFPSIGSWMRAHAAFADFPPDRARAAGRRLRDYLRDDPGLLRLGWFARFFRDLDMRSFSPAPELVNKGVCSRFGQNLAVFLPGGGEVRLDLSGSTGSFRVRAMNINTGAVAVIGTLAAGEPVVLSTPSTSDQAVILVWTR